MLFGLIQTRKDKRIKELEYKLNIANMRYMQVYNEVTQLKAQQVKIEPYKAVRILTRRELNMSAADRQRLALNDMCHTLTDIIRENTNVTVSDDDLGGKRYEMTVLMGFPKGDKYE